MIVNIDNDVEHNMKSPLILRFIHHAKWVHVSLISGSSNTCAHSACKVKTEKKNEK